MADDLEAQLRAAEARSRLASLDDDTLLPEDLAAVYLNISKKVLANMRANDGGPPFFKAAAKGAKAANQAVSYALGALRKWKAEHTFNNTLAANVALGLAFVARETPFFADKQGGILGNAFDQRQPEWGDWMAGAIVGELDVVLEDPKELGARRWANQGGQSEYLIALRNTPKLDPAAEFSLRVFLASIDSDRVMEWKRHNKKLSAAPALIIHPDDNGKLHRTLTLESSYGLLNAKTKADAIAILEPTTSWQTDLGMIDEPVLMLGPIISLLAHSGADPLAVIKHGINTKRLPNGGCALVQLPNNQQPATVLHLLMGCLGSIYNIGRIVPERFQRLRDAIIFLSKASNPHRFELTNVEITHWDSWLSLGKGTARVEEVISHALNEEMKARAVSSGHAIGQAAHPGIAGGFVRPTGGRRNGGV